MFMYSIWSHGFSIVSFVLFYLEESKGYRQCHQLAIQLVKHQVNQFHRLCNGRAFRASMLVLYKGVV